MKKIYLVILVLISVSQIKGQTIDDIAYDDIAYITSEIVDPENVYYSYDGESHKRVSIRYYFYDAQNNKIENLDDFSTHFSAILFLSENGFLGNFMAAFTLDPTRKCLIVSWSKKNKKLVYEDKVYFRLPTGVSSEKIPLKYSTKYRITVTPPPVGGAIIDEPGDKAAIYKQNYQFKVKREDDYKNHLIKLSINKNGYEEKTEIDQSTGECIIRDVQDGLNVTVQLIPTYKITIPPAANIAITPDSWDRVEPGEDFIFTVKAIHPYNFVKPLQITPDTYTAIPTGNPDEYKIENIQNDLTIVTAAACKLTLSADSKFKTYDTQSFPNDQYTFSVQGIIDGKTPEQILSGTPVFSGNAITAVNKGNYSIEITGLGSLTTTDDKYVLLEADIPSYGKGTLTIDPAIINISANDQSKKYDGQSFPADQFTCTVQGIIDGKTQEQVIKGIPVYGDEAINTVDAGTHSIEITGLGSLQSIDDNYIINPDISAFGKGILTINPVPLRIVVNNQFKIYDGQPFPADQYTYIVEGIVDGKSQQQLVSGTPVFGGEAVNAIVPGNYTIETIAPGNLELTDNNYSLNMDVSTFEKGVLTIECIPVTLTAQPENASICIGSEHTLTAEVLGSISSYQWYFNDQAIAGADKVNYTITDAKSGTDYGDYKLEVQGFCSPKIFTDVARIWIADSISRPFILDIPDIAYTGQRTRLHIGQSYGYNDVTNYIWTFGQPHEELDMEGESAHTIYVTFDNETDLQKISLMMEHACGPYIVSKDIKIQNSTAIAAIKDKTKTSIYPNPVERELRIKNEEVRIESVVVTDINGRSVYQAYPESMEYTINVESWPKGTYLVRIITKTGTITQKVVKR